MSVLVVVTGGSRGIGAAVCRAAPDGARIVDVSRSGGAPRAEHLSADLSDPASWSTVGDRFVDLVADHDRTILVHAAGTLTPVGFAGEVDGDDYATAVLLNAAAGQVLGHHYLAAVRGRPGRHQVCMVTSGAATSAYPGWSVYGPGKAALDHWVRTVGEEQHVRGGVEVCAVAPGVVDTAMQEQIRGTDPADFPRVGKFHQLYEDGQLRDPDAVARQLWSVLDAGVAPGTVRDLRA